MMRPNRSAQQGVIFLALVLVLFVTGGTVVLSALNNRQHALAAQQAAIREEMANAKQALIAYAATVYMNFGDGPGHLPCPDLDNDGVPEPDCDPSTEYFGRLPQYVPLLTVDSNGAPNRFYLSHQFANIDRQFWYAVSPAYLHTDVGGLQANSTISAALGVDGTSDIVAVIIAPGEELEGQDRVSGSPEYAQYLDGSNGASYQFSNSYAFNPEVFNDAVLPITRDEIWSVALLDVVKTIKIRLDNYRTSCGSYPRSFMSSSCNFNFSSELTNFRSVMNSTTAAVPAPTWIMSNSASITGEQNWIGIVSSYSYSSANQKATLAFSSCATRTYTFSSTSNISVGGTAC